MNRYKCTPVNGEKQHHIKYLPHFYTNTELKTSREKITTLNSSNSYPVVIEVNTKSRNVDIQK